MRLESMHIGMKVQHPEYGMGTVKNLSEHQADIRFDNGGLRTLSPEHSEMTSAEAQAELTGLTVPLATLIGEMASALVKQMGLEKDDTIIKLLGARWNNGTLILKPSDASLQPKDVPLEVFFHKIVMLRNNLRVLEQKINAHEKLSDGEKVEMQQYITRCYGSLTTFNILFKEKEDQF